MKRRGFTWIELLVVLAIIMALAALLFPLFARSRERNPSRSSCQQNVRQIGLAIKQYLSDYNETFPIVRVGVEPFGAEPFGWADAAQPYVRNTQLFQCPSDPSQPGPGAFNGSDRNYTDYFYNSNMAGVDESKLTQIAATVMLGDAAPGDARRHCSGGSTWQPGAARLVDTTGALVGAALRHLDGANYAFADGHVKWIKGADNNTCPALKNVASGVQTEQYGFAIR